MNLEDHVDTHFRLQKNQKTALKKLGIITIKDLVYHFPTRYEDVGVSLKIEEVRTGEKVVLYGVISKLKLRKAWKRKIPMSEGRLTDETGHIDVLWLNQAYIAKMFSDGMIVKIEGKVSEKNGKSSLINPTIERASYIPEKMSTIGKEKDLSIPVYSESRGVTSRWLYYAIQKTLASGISSETKDPVPEEMLKRYNLPKLKSALVWIHTPKNSADNKAARKRFAFEEVFLIQIKKQMLRIKYNDSPSFKIIPKKESLDEFIKKFPFTPTKAQNRSVKEILKDLGSAGAMSRLLEGDVGSGKTFVAATTAYAVVTTNPEGQDFGNLQVAYMAPTEILATQLFESFIEFFKPSIPRQSSGQTGSGQETSIIQIGLITSSGCRKFPSKVDRETWTKISRTQLLKWVENGEIPILIGTHSLIQKTVEFKHLAYVIIDEQHRFGTNQRSQLVRKSTRMETQIDADKKDTKLLYRELSYKIRGAVYSVRKQLGSGYKEKVYQKALAEELRQCGINFEQEKQLPVFYNRKKVGVYVPDFLIDKKIILELKALPITSAKEKKQMWDYIKGTDYKVAMLVNFGTPELYIHRIVYDSARKNLRESASDSRKSAKQVLPHLLSMTATPIPRTLALTVYGDLDLTLLDEMPKGRKPVITEIINKKDRDCVYEKIRAELNNKRQVYVITPRIDEPNPEKIGALRVKSVKAEAKRLKKDVFPEFEIDVLHGKLSSKEKNPVMKKFSDGDTDILVATSVVEVGVNIPNATIIIIESPERFGLAQLHQLRGRVLRSTHQSYCYLFPDTKSSHSINRLKALQKSRSGFELAEEDLKLRGAGELYGRSQWGISDIGMEAIKNIKMVEAARKEAGDIIQKDPKLKNLPLLSEHIQARGEIHFE